MTLDTPEWEEGFFATSTAKREWHNAMQQAAMRERLTP
jgi:hypothetical protein